MMPVEVRLGDVTVSADAAEAAEPVAGGALLTARQVTVRYPGVARRFYRHGWQSWSATRWLDLDEPVHRVPVADLRALEDDPMHALDERHGGAVVGALAGDGPVLLLGAVGLDGYVTVTDDGMRGSAATTDRWFVALGSEEEVFARYADVLGERLGHRQAGDLRVWCSWYSFYAGITEASLGKVIDDLAGLGFSAVQVDDGWQRNIGDWEANADFPSGMPALADRIRTAGFTPGLWLAPFLVHEGSQAFEEHPEWLLRADTGLPVSAGWNWGGRNYALDVTQPAALEHIVEVIRTAVGWGFAYLKLDFLYAGALPGVHARDVDRHEGYRQAVEAIRAAVGDEVLLLACGAPVIPSIGVFDAIRVGPDVAEVWEVGEVTRYLHRLGGPQARYAVATSVHRLWLQPLIATDPDVAYFRTRYCLLTRQQKALVQDLTRVCRFRATSDIPATLDPDERAALAAYLEEEVDVRPDGRYRYAIDGRSVDFGPVAAAAPVFLPLDG